MSYLAGVLSEKETPQSEPIPGTAQVPNSAGGFGWAVDDWVRLERFLVLGSEGGSYYAIERKLTVDNAQAVKRCVLADGQRTVAKIAEISQAGRAPKNDSALFALAVAASFGSAETKAAAFAALPRVARIGTHLFHFADYIDGLRGWGRGLRSAVAAWYQEQEPKALAYQAVKYQSRDGWSHRDLLRLSHPKAVGDVRNTLYGWMTKGWESVGEEPHPDEALRLIWAFERAKRAEKAAEVVGLIRDYGLPREGVPTQFLGDASVWEALLADMPTTALIRNLATLTRVGLIAPLSAGTRQVVTQIGDTERLRKARVHPLAVLVALKTYQQGHGERGSNTWSPVTPVVDALDAAFYAAFGNVESTGKRWLLALDVSGSMECGQIAGMPGITPRVGSAAMALITAATEPAHQFVAFTSGGYQHAQAGRSQWAHMGMGNGITPLTISPRQRLDDVVRQVAALPMGGTDCALPMLYATEKRLESVAVVGVTDSETWAGSIHPAQALRQYRDRMSVPAKLIVVGLVSGGFTIADPNDAGMLDVVGFDTATPNLMAQFAQG